MNYAIFLKLCDRMRFEVNCAKSHHRVISDGLHTKHILLSPYKFPLANKPPVFRGGKLISPPFYTPPPSVPPLHHYSSQTINLDWSVMVYSGWKFILFLVFGRMTSNFMCWTFSTLCSSSLWRIVTIFLVLAKAVWREKPCSHWCILLN